MVVALRMVCAEPSNRAWVSHLEKPDCKLVSSHIDGVCASQVLSAECTHASKVLFGNRETRTATREGRLPGIWSGVQISGIRYAQRDFRNQVRAPRLCSREAGQRCDCYLGPLKDISLVNVVNVISERNLV